MFTPQTSFFKMYGTLYLSCDKTWHAMQDHWTSCSRKQLYNIVQAQLWTCG